MSLDNDDIVWAFDGRDGRAHALAAMLHLYAENLEALLPTESDDAFEQIVADLADDPTTRMLGNPRLARLFPPALSDPKGSDEFWRDSIHSQARARLAAARVVVEDLSDWEGFVPVTLARADDWAKVIGALRLFWYTEIAGPGRLDEPTPQALAKDGGLHDLIDWLGFLLEDLLESLQTCLQLDASLDPDEFGEADPE